MEVQKDTMQTTIDLSKLQLETLVNKTSSVSITDKSGTIVYVNDLFCQVTGLERSELIGKNHRVVNSQVHPPIFFKNMWDTISSGEEWSGPICSKNKKGEYFWLQTNIFPIKDEQGLITHYVSFRTEITSHKAAISDLEEKVKMKDDQLLKSEKAAYIGMQTAEIVHNLNNPLTILKGNIMFLQEMYPDDFRIKKAADALERMHETIKSILHSSRQSNNEEFQDCDMNQIIIGELKILETDKFFRYGVKLNLELGVVPMIKGKPTHFAQTLGNLVKNAVEAMHGGKNCELTVQTRTKEKFLHILIKDTGRGIPPHHLERIFDPFFTTKPQVAKSDEPTGTGLGLASVKRILEHYGAELSVDSEQDKGTSILIQIPLQSSEKKLKAS